MQEILDLLDLMEEVVRFILGVRRTRGRRTNRAGSYSGASQRKLIASRRYLKVLRLPAFQKNYPQLADETANLARLRPLPTGTH